MVLSARGASLGASMLLVAAAGCSLVTDFDALEGSGAADASVLDAAPGTGDAAATDGGHDATVGVDADAGPVVVDAEAGTSYPYRDAVMVDEPSSYWPFDEPTGSLVAADVVGGHDGTIEGPTELGVPGLDGRTALKVSSSSTTIRIGDIYPFDSPDPFAIELWILPDLTGDYNNLFDHRSGTNGWVAYVSKDGNVSYEQGWESGGSRGIFTGTGHVYSQLTQVVFSFDGTQMSLYVDGVSYGNGYTGGDPDPPDYESTLSILLAYTGVIDEVSIYEHALAPARVQAHRQAAGQ